MSFDKLYLILAGSTGGKTSLSEQNIPMRLTSSSALLALAVTGIAAGSLNALTTTHFIGGNIADASITPDKDNGSFGQFFDNGNVENDGLPSVTGSYTGLVNGVDFSYDIKFTAIGASAKLYKRNGAFLISDNATATGRFTEGPTGYGFSVEILNLTDTGGANNAGFNVVFDGYGGFSTANSAVGSLMTFTPTNTEATNTDSSLSFDRTSGDGKDTITLATDDTTTLAEWTAGATAMNVYGGRLSDENYPELRNLIYSFSTVAVPEPGTYALIAGMLGLTCVMLRRRRL